MAVILYLRPDILPTTPSGDGLQASALGLLEWMWIGALGGILATSVIALSFYLLYSPFYLITEIWRLAGTQKWVDAHEQRFYCWCFLMLCFVGGAALVHPPAAGVVLIILAGLAPLLCRVLL
jgi:hypothetical protein